jgi:hypothetical protein
MLNPGNGRESVRSLHNGIEVTEIIDVTNASQWMSSSKRRRVNNIFKYN